MNIFICLEDVRKQSEGEGSSKEIKIPQKPTTSTSNTLFYSFYQLCAELFNEPSYNAKTSIVKMFLNKGSYYLGIRVKSQRI